MHSSHSTTQMPSAVTTLPSGGEMFINIAGALLIILLAIMVTAWLVRRCGVVPHRLKGQKGLAIVTILSVGQRERIVLVNSAGEWLLLGVTANHITLLATLDKDAMQQVSSEPSPALFQNFLMQKLAKNKHD